MAATGKAAIVTVHGTGDTAKELKGEKWFQQGSPFAQGLQGQLRERGVDADIVPHLWSGANSAWDRERAANKLAHKIRGLYDKYNSIHVVGHSHGGNVANDAAVLLKWGLRQNAVKERFDSLTTVGTPFFNMRTGPVQMFGGLLFICIAYGSVLLFPFLAGFFVFDIATGGQLTDGAADESLIALVYLGLVLPCVLFMLTMSRQGVRRILRPKTGDKTRTSVLAIWHEHDEAIAFLQRVEEVKLEAFPRGSLYRGSRSAAIGFGLLAVLVIAVAIPGLIGLGIDLFEWGSTESGQGTTSEDFFIASGAGLVLAPVSFTVLYFAYRFIVGGMQELAARSAMNGFVSGVMRGVAMGRDGDQVLCQVAPRSHTHRTQELVLVGDCAERMKVAANGAAGKLIDKYRWALFSVGGNSSASITSLTTDAMTWDSLIHTTYFDQPEVAVAIADHVARTVRESAHGVGAASSAPASAAAAPPSPAAAAAPAPQAEPVPAAEPAPAQAAASAPPPQEPPGDAAPQPA